MARDILIISFFLPFHKNGNYLIVSSYLEELLNLMCTQLFPLSSGSQSFKCNTFNVKWQSEASDDGKTYKNPKSA